MAVPLLEIRGLAVDFPAPAGISHAVRELSFSIAPGEVVGLAGESGSGKSAAALAVMRLLPPQARMSGGIFFEGRDLTAAGEAEMRRLRGAEIAMIFQEPMTALNPVMRAGEQIAEAVRAHARVTRRQAAERALEALRVVAMPDPGQQARAYPHQLSGGMRQRVMIAMAIVNRPRLLIADEPTTALDVTIQAQILELLAELRRRFGLAMLLISHDLAVTSQVAQRIAVMYAGSIVESGSRNDIFAAPAHPYTRGLLQAAPTLTVDRSRPLAAIEGAVPAASALPPGCAFEPRCSWRRPECALALPPLKEISSGHLVRCPVAASGEMLPAFRL
jgi:oligopeptide/dipeptide ABC transporter ATP-binding protein